MPMRAHIIWTGAIRGQVRSAVHSIVVPNWAPASEYVAMPDGSSSAAPVITPGPIAPAMRTILLFRFDGSGDAPSILEWLTYF